MHVFSNIQRTWGIDTLADPCLCQANTGTLKYMNLQTESLLSITNEVGAFNKATSGTIFCACLMITYDPSPSPLRA